MLVDLKDLSLLYVKLEEIVGFSLIEALFGSWVVSWPKLCNADVCYLRIMDYDQQYHQRNEAFIFHFLILLLQINCQFCLIHSKKHNFHVSATN